MPSGSIEDEEGYAHGKIGSPTHTFRLLFPRLSVRADW